MMIIFCFAAAIVLVVCNYLSIKENLGWFSYFITLILCIFWFANGSVLLLENINKTEQKEKILQELRVNDKIKIKIVEEE